MRNRRVTSRDAESTDLFSSSLIFGNVGGGSASTQQQSLSTSSFSSGAPYLLDGSGRSRRSPGGSLRHSPASGQNFSSDLPPSGGAGGRPVRNNRPPITSLLEKHARGGLAVDRIDYDSHRSPHASALDRTHISMSVANTSFQDPFGDISFASDGSGTFGAFSGGFHADSALKPAHGQVRMQTPYARKGRFGYTDDEDEDENERSVNSSVVTPLWGREGLSTLSSGGRSEDITSSRLGGRFSSSGGRDRENTSIGGDSHHPSNGQSNRMMFPPTGSAESHFDRGVGGEVFDQLEASWLLWVLVSGVSAGVSTPSSGSSSVSKVLMRMQQFGDIVEHIVSNGNWIFIKFSSPFHAERAITEPLIFLGSGLDSHVMLSITRLNSNLARNLNLHMDSKGSISLENKTTSTVLGVTSPFPSSRHAEKESRFSEGPGINLQLRGNLNTVEDTVSTDLYLRPPKKRTGSICTRIMEYIFSY